MRKRANGEGTISQRSSDGRWIGQISVPNPDPKACRQIRKTVSGKTQAECKKRLEELKKKFETNTYTLPTKLTYTEYLKSWLEQKSKLEKLKPSTIATHSNRIKLYIDPYFGKAEIQKITLQMLNSFYTALAGKVGAHTVHKVHNIINNSFKFAVRDGLIPFNPATNALLPKFIIEQKSALSSDDLAKLMSTAKAYQSQPTTKTKNAYPLISLAVNTGCRRGELAALQWDEVDLENNTITIRQAVMEINGHCLIGTPKTESSIRTIYISPAMTEILEGHRQVATGKFVFPALNNPDKPMMPSHINRFFYAVTKKAGLKCGFHTLRHSHITQLIENGVNIKTIKDRAGHSQISTTMGYCHPSKIKDMQAASIFDQFIK
jgi:integrase